MLMQAIHAIHSRVSPALQALRQKLMPLHHDERGDNENLGRLLILALVLIPLIILITIFGDAIYAEAQAKWNEVMGAGVG